MDITEQHVKKPTKEIDNIPLHAEALTKQVDPTRYVNNSNFYSEPYIQDSNAHSANTNTSTTKYHSNIEDVLDLSDLPVQDIRTFSHTAPKNRGERTDYVHDDIELSRNIPGHQGITNKADRSKYKRNQYTNSLELSRNIPTGSFSSNIVGKGASDHGSRTARLIPKIQPGGFHNGGQKPMMNRMQEVAEPYESQKSRTSRIVMESMQGRFDRPAPWAKY